MNCITASVVLYFLIGDSVITILLVSATLLVYVLGINMGGGTAQSVYKIYQQYQLRDLSLPHGNLPCY